MQGFILRRALQGVVALWAVTLIVFLLTRATGDPAKVLMPWDVQGEAELQKARVALGLDRPLYVQYGLYMGNLLRGDLGRSFFWDEPVLRLVGRGLAGTFQLVALAIVLSGIVGLGLGILSAVKRDSIFDTFGKALAILGQSAPTFWVGIVLILIFAVGLGWVPASGKESWKSIILPTINLGWFSTAALLRLTRSSMLDVLDSEFIKMERIKGAPERIVILKHALKNASLPVITLFALQMASLVTGALITETIFAWPGIGRLAIVAIQRRDFPTVQGVVLVAATFYILINMLVDIAYAFLDPRIRLTLRQ